MSLLHLLCSFFGNLAYPCSALAIESNSYCIMRCYYLAYQRCCSRVSWSVTSAWICMLDEDAGENWRRLVRRGILKRGWGRIGRRFVEFVQSLSTVYMDKKNQQKNLNSVSITQQARTWDMKQSVALGGGGERGKRLFTVKLRCFQGIDFGKAMLIGFDGFWIILDWLLRMFLF